MTRARLDEHKYIQIPGTTALIKTFSWAVIWAVFENNLSQGVFDDSLSLAIFSDNPSYAVFDDSLSWALLEDKHHNTEKHQE